MTNYSYLERRLADGDDHALLNPSTSLDKLDKSSRTSDTSMQRNDQSFSEASPLVSHQTYDTFVQQPTVIVKGKPQLIPESMPPSVQISESMPPSVQFSSSERSSFLKRLCCHCCRANISSRENNRERLKKAFGIDCGAWTTVVIISILIAIVAYFHGDGASSDKTNPSWHFDYNVYISRTHSVQRTNRVALIAQVASSRPLENFSLISSLPNRAYAKAWGQDYVRYNAGRKHVYERSCFDKVLVLNEILRQQLMEDNDDGGTLYRWAQRPFRVKYDTIVILPPDAIIIELDTDIIGSMLPSDRLVAIAGWDENRMIDSHSGIVVFNLNHRYSSAVAKLWREYIRPMNETCGANNDLEILISSIYAVMDRNDSIDDLIAPLSESRNGFTANHLIKSLVPAVPGYRAKYFEKTLVESKTILQQTAASVCYRFYPKCEVVL